MPLRDFSRVLLLAMVTLAGVFPLLAQNKPGSMAGSPAKVTAETGGKKLQETAQKTENDSGKGARRDARLSVLRHWVDTFSMALEVAAKLGIVVLIVLVAWYVGHEVRRDVLIVDPFSVPERFEKVGLNPRVMANRIGYFLSQIEAETKATSVKKDVLGFSHQEVSLDIEIPGTKLGLKTVIEIVRNVVGRHPKHLSGDFALGVVPEAAEPALIPDSEVTITVYVTQGRNPSSVKSKKVKSSKVNELVQCAAEMALEQINPWMFAAYLHDHKNDEAALKILRRMATDTREVLLHRQAALSLWGSILAGQGEPEQAIERYKAALELDPKYPIAHMNWANALRRQHKYAEAVEEYKKAIELDPKFASVYGQWGILLAGQEKYDEAIGKYKKAIEIDPMNVGAYIMWGEALRARRV
jgi:Tetratricopeptide repeat/TPR repeat